MKIFQLLFGALMILVFAVLWLFYGEVVMVFATVFFNFIKGISASTVLGFLGGILFRFFFIFWPRKILFFLAWLHVPKRQQAVFVRKVNQLKRALRRQATRFRLLSKTRFGLLGMTMMGIAVTGGILYLSYIYSEVGLTYAVGVASLFKTTKWLQKLFMESAPVFVLKTRFLALLNRAVQFLVQYIPAHYLSVLKHWKRHVLEGIVVRRGRIRRVFLRRRKRDCIQRLYILHKTNR